MKHLTIILVTLMVIGQTACSQKKPVNWTPDQLEQPADLAKKINAGKNVPMIINVGPGAIIPNSLDAGMTNNQQGINNLKTILEKLDKKANIVIYCGCCPFDNCPNVRPAIEVLKQNKFTNYHLLNLPQNINADWISKGYPTTKR